MSGCTERLPAAAGRARPRRAVRLARRHADLRCASSSPTRRGSRNDCRRPARSSTCAPTAIASPSALRRRSLRGHASLLPPNALADTLARLPRGLRRRRRSSLGDGLHDGADRRRHAGHRAAVAVPAGASSHAACLLTSGSTGAPQPHAKRWGTLVANIDADGRRLAEMLGRASLAGAQRSSRRCRSQHSYGLESSVLLALLGGAAFDSGRPFYPADVRAALAAPAATARAGDDAVPSEDDDLLAGVALPPVDLVLCGHRTAVAAARRAGRAGAFAAAADRDLRLHRSRPGGDAPHRRTATVWRTFGDRVRAGAMRRRRALRRRAAATSRSRRRSPTCSSSRARRTSGCSAAPTT